MSDIVVVDDASADTLAPMADARVVLIRHNANRGVGGATLTGLAR